MRGKNRPHPASPDPKRQQQLDLIKALLEQSNRITSWPHGLNQEEINFLISLTTTDYTQLSEAGKPAEAQNRGPAGQPQTVCLTIKAQQIFFSAGTAFAKHCTTFKPQ